MTILASWFIADFISGLAHWAQDRLLKTSNNKFWNQVIADNVLHHDKPAEMLKFSLFENIRISATVMWPLSLALFLIGAPTIIWLPFLLVSFGNAVHWFSHKRTVNPVIKILQATGLFASFHHHKAHHMSGGRLVERGNAQIKYCVMTNWVNPLLDGIKFFPFLETIFRRGARATSDDSQTGRI